MARLIITKNISPKVLEIAKGKQKGRADYESAMADFNFTERWFRDSGLYDLNETYQEAFMETFKNHGKKAI